MTNWWEVDTSATLRIVCVDCGTVTEYITNIEATKGEKIITIDGYCPRHQTKESSEDDE